MINIKALPLLFVPCIVHSYEIKGKVIKVYDGDTVTILSKSHEKHKIRLADIDAPERKQPFGNQSRKMLARLVSKKQVTAKCKSKDRYKRNICTIYINKYNTNEHMVAYGGAWVYRRYYKGNKYITLESIAKSSKLGLWKSTEYRAIPPWKWRRNN